MLARAKELWFDERTQKIRKIVETVLGLIFTIVTVIGIVCIQTQLEDFQRYTKKNLNSQDCIKLDKTKCPYWSVRPLTFEQVVEEECLFTDSNTNHFLVYITTVSSSVYLMICLLTASFVCRLYRLWKFDDLSKRVLIILLYVQVVAESISISTLFMMSAIDSSGVCATYYNNDITKTIEQVMGFSMFAEVIGIVLIIWNLIRYFCYEYNESDLKCNLRAMIVSILLLDLSNGIQLGWFESIPLLELSFNTQATLLILMSLWTIISIIFKEDNKEGYIKQSESTQIEQMMEIEARKGMI